MYISWKSVLSQIFDDTIGKSIQRIFEDTIGKSIEHIFEVTIGKPIVYNSGYISKPNRR